MRGLRITTLALLLLPLNGCGLVNRTWHDRVGWQAEEYFDDRQVIALCEAIERDDLAEIDRLIAIGADVNAKGKGNMTPLLWAFPDNKLRRFTRLLEHGANPNVILEETFPPRGGGIRAGLSVTHMACKTSFPGYFEAVFENGGDVNLVNGGKGNITETPIFKVIKGGVASRRAEHIQFLADNGADLDYVNGAGMTPCMCCVTSGEFALALTLLEAGANPRLYANRQNSRLIHTVSRVQEAMSRSWTAQQERDFDKLLRWLEERGELLSEAERDRKRWRSWRQSGDMKEYRRKLDAEIAERKAQERRAAKQAREAQQADDE